jgi:hypothetical protein
MSVTNVHPEYSIAFPLWEKVRAALAGDQAIKNGGTKYLPAEFALTDVPRYTAYKDRSYFIPATSQAHNSMLGMVFRKPATFELTQGIDPLLNNINNSGSSLEQFAKYAVSEVDSVGRFAILVDFPSTEGTLTRAQMAAGNIRPFLSAYYAESLINWKTETVDGNNLLTLAVLREQVDVSVNEFDHDFKYQYRVLRLTDGVYTQQLYNDSDTPLEEPRIILQGNGETFDHIPLHIAGAEDNGIGIDEPVLLGLAILNIAHYQTTADHRENLYIHGQLTIGVTTDMTSEQFKAANPNGVQVGARRGHFLGENGAFHTVTAPESSSLRVALQDIESQMISIGAKLIVKGGQAETAEAVRTNASAEASVLDNVVSNTSEAIKDALSDMARFLNESPDGIEYMLNKDFYDASIGTEQVNSITGLLTARLIAPQDAMYMVRTGKIELREDRTDEDIREDIANDLLNEPVPDLPTE